MLALELSNSRKETCNTFEGESDEESACSADETFGINDSEDDVSTLSTALRFHDPYQIQHTPSLSPLIAPLPPWSMLTPAERRIVTPLRPTKSIIQEISSTSSSHFPLPPRPEVSSHSPSSPSQAKDYPTVMPGALPVADSSPPQLSAKHLMQSQPYTSSFASDLNSSTTGSSYLDEQLQFYPDHKPDFISLTATDEYSDDEETNKL